MKELKGHIFHGQRKMQAGQTPPVSNVFQTCPQRHSQQSFLRGTQAHRGQRMRGPELSTMPFVGYLGFKLRVGNFGRHRSPDYQSFRFRCHSEFLDTEILSLSRVPRVKHKYDVVRIQDRICIMADRREAARKAWKTRRRMSAWEKAHAAEAASKAALESYCIKHGWKVAFFEGKTGSPRTGIIDAVVFRIARGQADVLDLRLVQLKGGKAGVRRARSRA